MNSKRIVILLLTLAGWIILYLNLQIISDFIVDNIFGLEQGKHLTESIRFFIIEVPKVMLLLVLVIFIVGIVLEKLKLQKYVADWVYQVKSNQQAVIEDKLKFNHHENKIIRFYWRRQNNKNLPSGI